MDEKDRKIYELEQEQKLEKRFDSERENSDKRYAIKLAENAIFTLVGLICIAVVGLLIKVALGYINMNG